MIFKSNISNFAAASFLILLNLQFPPAGNITSFPSAVECVVQPLYRHRSDGKPGREIILNFKGHEFSGKGTIELECARGEGNNKS